MTTGTAYHVQIQNSGYKYTGSVDRLQHRCHHANCPAVQLCLLRYSPLPRLLLLDNLSPRRVCRCAMHLLLCINWSTFILSLPYFRFSID